MCGANEVQIHSCTPQCQALLIPKCNMYILHWTSYIEHWTLYILQESRYISSQMSSTSYPIMQYVHCTLNIVHCTSYIEHCTMYILQAPRCISFQMSSTSYNPIMQYVHRTLNIVQCTSFKLYKFPNVKHFLSHNAICTSYIEHWTLYILQAPRYISSQM